MLCKFKCKKCGKDIVVTQDWSSEYGKWQAGADIECSNCYTTNEIPNDLTPIPQPQKNKLNKNKNVSSNNKNDILSCSFLRLMAVLQLLLGIVFGSILIFSGIDTDYYGEIRIINGVNLGTGIGLILETITICVFLFIVAGTHETVIEIKNSIRMYEAD